MMPMMMTPMVTKKPTGSLEYQIEPYEYYVKDFFLAKCLLYVLPYKDDDLLYPIALEEAAKRFKVQRSVIQEHVANINTRST